MLNNNMFPIAKLISNEISELTTINPVYYEDDCEAENAKVMLLGNDSAVPVSSMINKVIELDEVGFTYTEVNGNDGVKYPTVRTIIMTKEGEVFATNSKVFSESVAMILNICGAPRCWTKPRYFKVSQIDLANAHRCYKLVMCKK